MTDRPDGIDERSQRFYLRVLEFLERVPETPKTKRLIEQLADSAGSIPANRAEARSSSSRRQFAFYNEVALRSANETKTWLRACAARRLGNRAECARLLDESHQLAKILASIVITTKRNGLDTET